MSTILSNSTAEYFRGSGCDILTKIWRILIFSNGNKSFLFSSVKQDTPHISIAPVLYIHWEWPVILQTLMYFTESTLLFISCNCSQSWLPGETRCWNRETISKKYKLSNGEWLCGRKKAFGITPRNVILEAESGQVCRALGAGTEGGAVAGLAVPPSPAKALAGRLWAHRIWLGAAASWAQCSAPNTFQMMNMMQTYWKKNIFLKRKTITSQSKTMKLNRRYTDIK